MNVTLEHKVRDRDTLDLTFRMTLDVLEGFRAEEVEIKNINQKRIKLSCADEEQMKIIKILGYEDILFEDKILLKE